MPLRIEQTQFSKQELLKSGRYIEIEERGKAPYTVWNQSEDNESKQPHKNIKTYLEAISILSDLSEFGKGSYQSAYMADGDGNKVFDLTNDEDLSLMRSLDGFGLIMGDLVF